MAGEPVGIGMIGLGTVGGGVAELLGREADLYAQRVGRPVELRRVLVRDRAKAERSGLVPAARLTDDPEAFFADASVQIVVEVAGGLGPVEARVRRALESGRHVVTANKSLLAARGPELFALARSRGVSIAFEASCAGGIPCVTALQFGLMANRIDGLFGILNGTCNFILSEMTGKGRTYPQALADAQRLGYAEADPTLDVSGQDAAQKLSILASLAFGVSLPGDAVPAVGIDTLDLADLRYGRELGYAIKLLAIARRDAETQAIEAAVQPCFVPADDPLAAVGGAFNALLVHGHAVGRTLYYGPGAGRAPTASAVVSDVLNVASGWYPRAFAQMRLTPDCHAPARLQGADETHSAYYLRVNALDRPAVLARIASVLGQMGISLSAVLQHESDAGQFVPVVITTHETRAGDIRLAADKLASMDVIQGSPVMIRIASAPA